MLQVMQRCTRPAKVRNIIVFYFIFLFLIINCVVSVVKLYEFKTVFAFIYSFRPSLVTTLSWNWILNKAFI